MKVARISLFRLTKIVYNLPWAEYCHLFIQSNSTNQFICIQIWYHFHLFRDLYDTSPLMVQWQHRCFVQTIPVGICSGNYVLIFFSIALSDFNTTLFTVVSFGGSMDSCSRDCQERDPLASIWKAEPFPSFFTVCLPKKQSLNCYLYP